MAVPDENLRQYATDRQWELYTAVCDHGSNQKAAVAIGVNRRGVDKAIVALKRKAALAGYSPEHSMTRTVPDGFKVKGVSSYYNADGELTGQWVKSSTDQQRQLELMSEAIEALKEELPIERPRPAPRNTLEKLASCYVITDYHLGMMSWHEETGADWDLKIAENMLVDWFAAAISMTPNSKVGIFAQLGDFIHWDGLEAVTPTSRHVLDADTRFQKVVRCVIRVVRRLINMLLLKHEQLHVLMADANHDPASGVWLRELLAAMYSDEPRITVDNSADSYYCYEHGKTSLFFHHGHKRKVANIDDVFVAKFREVFGRTSFSYAHMGHLHSVDVKETNLMIVEQHRTLAAADAYASRGGWISGRDAKVITYHSEYGEVMRHTINPDMLRAA